MEHQRRSVPIAVVAVLVGLAGLAAWYLPQVVQQVEDRNETLERIEAWGSVRVPGERPAGVPGFSLHTEMMESTEIGLEGFLVFEADDTGLQAFVDRSGFRTLVECAPGAYDWPVTTPDWWLQVVPPRAPCVQDVTAEGVVRTVVVIEDTGEDERAGTLWPLTVYLYLHEAGAGLGQD